MKAFTVWMKDREKGQESYQGDRIKGILGFSGPQSYRRILRSLSEHRIMSLPKNNIREVKACLGCGQGK